MTRGPKKIFTIERKRGQVPAASASESTDTHAILAAVQALSDRLDAQLSAAPNRLEIDAEQASKIDLIQTEMADISGRIRATKAEIAALRHPLAQDDQFGIATSELSAIVSQTEGATEQIMDAGERVEAALEDLLSQDMDDYAKARLGDISDEITKIYENCNFQDLTGQRITKVISVLTYIEERVDAMVGAWNIKEFETMPLPDVELTRKDEDLSLTGPAQETTQDTFDQDDIDALFD